MKSRKLDSILIIRVCWKLAMALGYLFTVIKCFVGMYHDSLSREILPFEGYALASFAFFIAGFIERCFLCGLVQDFKDLFFPEES